MTVQELKGRFQAIVRIKKGGQKIVYKATTFSGDIVALKVISNAADPRVLQEIEILKGINHRLVPKILESGLASDELVGEDILYIIEEYINGISLRDWIKSGKKFNLVQAYYTLHTLLEIELELEKLNILHRDINPNNIILCDVGTVHLIDFGLAKDLGGVSLTRTAASHGPFTPGYAPHEQFANMKMEQDARTDLFQIGVTIYECCNGSNPFVRPYETPYQIMSRTMTLTPAALTLEGDSEGLFSQFVSMLMAKNQSQRPDTASDAMRYLKAIKSSLELEGM